MKWTVLGYQSPYPGPGGGTPGYLLENGEVKILIDCGSGVLSQLAKWADPWALDAVILSHLHNDHAVDIPILHYALLMADIRGVRKNSLPIFTPCEPADLASRLTYKQYIKLTDLNKLGEAEFSGITFSFLKTQHEVDCYAVKIACSGRTICYTADTGPETDWSSFGTHMDLLVVEGTYLSRDVPEGKRGHLSVIEAAQLAQAFRAKKCIITHLYPLYSKSDILTEARPYYEGELYIADIGLEIEV